MYAILSINSEAYTTILLLFMWYKWGIHTWRLCFHELNCTFRSQSIRVVPAMLEVKFMSGRPSPAPTVVWGHVTCSEQLIVDRCAACTFAASESSSRAHILCTHRTRQCSRWCQLCQPDSGVRVKQERVPGTFSGRATQVRNRPLFSGTESWGMFLSAPQLSHAD